MSKRRQPGRPPTIRSIVRLAEENPLWGFTGAFMGSKPSSPRTPRSARGSRSPGRPPGAREQRCDQPGGRPGQVLLGATARARRDPMIPPST